MRTTLTAAVFCSALLPATVNAGSFARCLLDRLPGTENDIRATAVFRLCSQQSPSGLASVKQGSGRGWFGYKSGAECTADKAADTRSHRAAYMISTACAKLYDPPTAVDRFLDEAEALRR